MKIAIIRSSTWLLEPASYNSQEIGLAKGLLLSGISTDIFMAGAVREPAAQEIRRLGEACIRLIQLPFRRLPGRQAYFPALLDLLAQGSYDVVQVHEESQITSASVAAWADRRGVPVVLCQGMYRKYGGVAGILQTIYDAIVLPSLRKRVSASIAKTSAAKEYLAGKGFGHVHVCPVGLDAEGLGRSSSDDAGDDGGNGRGDGLKHIVYVGMLEKRRNIAFLSEVFAELARARSDVRFSVAGDGPERETLLNRMATGGIADRFRYLGRIDQKAVADLYRSADAFVLPSSYEIYGMVILEAMYFGVPVFSTRTAGAVDIIRDGQNGFLMGSLHAGEWKRQIEAYLDGSERPAVRRSARGIVQERFLWDRACRAYADVYAGAVGKRAT